MEKVRIIRLKVRIITTIPNPAPNYDQGDQFLRL